VSRTQRLLIFDLDGTLVDTVGPSRDLFCEMLAAECRVPAELSRGVFTSLMGKGPRAQIDAVLRRVEAWDAARVEDLTRRYWQRDELHEPALFPEVLDVMTDLRKEGHTLIISSGSTPASVKRKTQVTGIDRLCRLALGSIEDDPSRAKGPGHFAMLEAALELAPGDLQERGVFIGDGAYDMQVASQAGMMAVGRTTGDNGNALRAAGANHLIADLRELRTLL
jgi:phosphoglycolate phosphatase-like HAD superfamily hydrolase